MTMTNKHPLVVGAIVIATLLASFTAVPSLTAEAAVSFSVNDTADRPDASPGDGICASRAGTCTLRAAVEEANTLPPLDSASISLPAGVHEIVLGPLVTEEVNLTIDGAGPGRTVLDARNRNRHITSFTNALPTLTVQGLTLRNGYTEDQGGSIGLTLVAVTLVEVEVVDNYAEKNGGAIWAAELSVINSSFRDNSTNGNGGAIFGEAPTFGRLWGRTVLHGVHFERNEATGDGGAVYTDEAVMSDSLVIEATAGRNGGGIAAAVGLIRRSTIASTVAGQQGGALFVRGEMPERLIDQGLPSRLLVQNSTFSAASSDVGGGVAVQESPFGLDLAIVSSTLADNAASEGGGFYSDGANRTTLTDTVVVDSLGDDCAGVPPTMLTTNHDSDGTCSASSTGDAMLEVLRDNGGGLLTHLPHTGSPLIDTGGTDCPGVDQHLRRRPTDGDLDGAYACDLGAVEAPGPVPGEPLGCDPQITPFCDQIQTPREPAGPGDCIADGPGCGPLPPLSKPVLDLGIIDLPFELAPRLPIDDDLLERLKVTDPVEP